VQNRSTDNTEDIDRFHFPEELTSTSPIVASRENTVGRNDDDVRGNDEVAGSRKKRKVLHYNDILDLSKEIADLLRRSHYTQEYFAFLSMLKERCKKWRCQFGRLQFLVAAVPPQLHCCQWQVVDQLEDESRAYLRA
tara:strand:+ start:1057 stop:1467 length:411 start_codon:yes stop_codon:yes gene_type:complete